MDIRLFLLKFIISAIPIFVMMLLALSFSANNIFIKSKDARFLLNAVIVIIILFVAIAAPGFSPRNYSRRYSRKAREAFNKNDQKECRKNMRIAFYLLDNEDQRKKRCKYAFNEQEAICFQILEEFHKEFDSKKR